MKANLDLHTRALQTAIKTLDGLGVQYKIKCSDGSEFGSLTEEKSAGRNLKYPFGAVRDYYVSFLQDMKPGETASVPVGDFDIDSIASGVSSWCVQNWGKGSTFTKKDRKNCAVVVLRVY